MVFVPVHERLEARQPGILPADLAVARRDVQVRAAIRRTAPCSPPGTAASSAAPDRTAPPSAARGRSTRRDKTLPTDRLLRLRARRRRSPTAADSARRRPTSTGSANGSRQRLHVSSSTVDTVPTSRKRSLILVDLQPQIHRRDDAELRCVRPSNSAVRTAATTSVSGCRICVRSRIMVHAYVRASEETRTPNYTVEPSGSKGPYSLNAMEP